MKALFTIFFLTSCAFAGQMNYSALPCKQKVFPIVVEHAESSGKASVKITADSKIKNFKILSARGLDGLEVTSEDLPAARDLKKGDTIKVETSINRPEGLSYLVLDLEGSVNSSHKKQTLTIPVGKPNQEQQKNAGKNIENASGKKKRHVMRLDTNS